MAFICYLQTKTYNSIHLL